MTEHVGMTDHTHDGFRPLHGVRVLELAQNLAGPYASHILADLGAAVIKVEPPGSGDAARSWGPPFVGGQGSIFAAGNRGKRSVALDVAAEPGRRALRRLIESSDILIEAFRPGAFDRLGYGYATVRGWNPALIYCSVLAYGETGPLRTLPGYDPLMQAHAGLMSVTGPADGEPARVGTSVVDMGTGMWLAIAILAALRDRGITGEGRRLSVSLYDTALAWNAYHISGYLATGFVPARMGSELPMIAPYGAYPTADGQLMIAAANDGLFLRLCRALRLEALGSDARFRDNPARAANRVALNDELARATASSTTQALLATLRAAGVPCAPIQDIAEVAADPQTAASGMLMEDEAGPALGVPIRWAGERNPVGSAPPEPGQHTAEVLGGPAPGNSAADGSA
jgi:crotonobetainyl-CoA:carnitine CoA-transferase CaiB-like acyl-CoA transferase